MIIRVVASSSGSGTYVVIGDCVFPQTTGVCPQSSGGKRSPRGESTFSTVLVADDGYEMSRIRQPIKQRTGQWLSHGGRPPSALLCRETPRPSPHETPPRTRVRPPREAPGR